MRRKVVKYEYGAGTKWRQKRKSRIVLPGHYLPNHRRTLVDLAHYAGELVESLVASLYEGRDSLTVPIERSKPCVEHGL